MPRIPIREAAARLGLTEKTLRRWVHEGKIAYQIEQGRYMFAESDIEAHQPGPSDSQRIEALERRVNELEQKLERLASPPRTKTLRPPRIPYTTEAPAPGETLPSGYTPIYDLIKQHGLTSQRQAIIRTMAKDGYLKTGHWKVAGHEVRNCLDAQGIEEFKRRYVQ